MTKELSDEAYRAFSSLAVLGLLIMAGPLIAPYALIESLKLDSKSVDDPSYAEFLVKKYQGEGGDTT